MADNRATAAPVEVITLTEYRERISKGEQIPLGTLILLPVTTLEHMEQQICELSTGFARLEELRREREQAIQVVQALEKSLKGFQAQAGPSTMSTQQITDLLREKLQEAEADSERASHWHGEALLTPQAEVAFRHISKAATQHTLLQSLLDEVEGKPASSLWDQ